jgi:hypothetical protein
VTPAEFEHLFRLTKSRADAGDPASMNALGSLYAEMALLRKEPAMLEDAERAFRTAADWGHEPAQRFVSSSWSAVKAEYSARIAQGAS